MTALSWVGFGVEAALILLLYIIARGKFQCKRNIQEQRLVLWTHRCNGFQSYCQPGKLKSIVQDINRKSDRKEPTGKIGKSRTYSN